MRGRRTMRTFISLLLLGVVGAAPADAVLCKTKAGAVALRDACRAKETTVEMAVVGPTGAPGSKGANGPAGSPPLRMIDAAGAAVGPVVNLAWYVFETAESLPGRPLIYVLLQQEALGGAALLQVDYAGLPGGSVYWTMAGCTGDAFVQGNTFLPVVEVIGDTVFVPAGPAGTPPIGAVEGVNDQSGCTSVTARGGCCRNATGTLPGAHVVTTTSIDALGIALPLRAVAP